MSPCETKRADYSLKAKNFVITSAIGVLLILVLFEIDWVLDFGRSNTVEVPDPDIEASYENCFKIKDDAMHRQAFGTIDNPDVQREFISANRAKIAADCRAEFPQETLSVEGEGSLNLIDLQPRFW